METQEAMLDELCTKVEDAGKLLEKGKAGEAASALEVEELVGARGRLEAAGTELDTSLEEATATCVARETEEEEERTAWVEESGGKEGEEVKQAMEVFGEEKVRAPYKVTRCREDPGGLGPGVGGGERGARDSER
jgi:hypothetical protein